MSYAAAVVAQTSYVNTTFGFERVILNGSNYGTSERSLAALVLATNKSYLVMWASDSSSVMLLDKDMPNIAHVPMVFADSNFSNRIESFVSFPNSRFYIPPINVSAVIGALFCGTKLWITIASDTGHHS